MIYCDGAPWHFIRDCYPLQGSGNPPDSVKPDLKTPDWNYIEGRGNTSPESDKVNLGLTLSSVEKTQPNYLQKGHVLEHKNFHGKKKI